ncbi:MAG: fimbrial biogenesis outer membrane usher protein [Comamonadaceae bacterium]|nr:MAG: fimbrial biogenesis outer membrane usher protein [Comamonadaceae bacterium]
MPTWKSRRCRWPTAVPDPARVLALAWLLSLGMGAGGVQMATAQAVGTAVAAGELELYLEVTLNGVADGRLSRFVQNDGALFASAASLRELGLKWPGSEQATGLLPLAGLPGLGVVYDGARQRLVLSAPLDLLDRPVTRFGLSQEPRPVADPAAVIPGLVFNYDVYAQQTQNIRTLSGFTETRLFGLGPGVWSNTMVSRAGTRQQGLPAHDNVRLDTFWQRDFADEMLSLSAGDVITGSLPWTRAARVGGIRLSRNFSLQPYRVTTPLASFQGSAVLPSTVDLFVNGLKQTSQQVQPGEFQLSGIPSLGGTGQAQMVITDINGQRRVVSFDLYGAPQLLDAGLTDWSLDLGRLREAYGLRSFDYGAPIVSATARHGLNAATTVEGHAEAGRGIVQAGAGGVWRLGEQGGVASASLAFSHGGDAPALTAAGGDASGRQWALGYQWNSRRFTVSLNTLRRDDGFRDVAALPGDVMSRGSDSLYLGVNGGWGQLGFSLIRQQAFDQPASRYAGLSWSRQLQGSNASISVNLNRNLDNAAESVLYVAWSMPLERKLAVSASLRSSGHSQSLLVDAARSPEGGDAGGIGWRVQAGAGDSTSGQAQLTQLGRYGQLMAGITQAGGQNGAPGSRSVYGSASGGVVVAQGQAHASRRVDDAFALVSAGVAGIPVQLENRVVGETDARGMLFVTQLSSHQTNRLAIDTLRLPPDMRIERSTLNVVPSSRSGVIASFPMRRVLAVELALRDAQGQWLPAGSRLWLEAGAAAAARAGAPLTVVGYDGLVYLEDPPAGADLRVELDGGSCRAALPSSPQPSGLINLGVLTCQ